MTEVSILRFKIFHRMIWVEFELFLQAVIDAVLNFMVDIHIFSEAEFNVTDISLL